MESQNLDIKISKGVRLVIHGDEMEISKKNKTIIKDKLENFILTWHTEKKSIGVLTLDVLFIHPQTTEDFQISTNPKNKQWEDLKYFADNVADIYFKKEIQEKFLSACGYGYSRYQLLHSGQNLLESGISKNEDFDTFRDALLTFPGFSSSFVKKEVKYLYEALNPNEKVYGVTNGNMDGNTWIIACTDKRILFVDKGLLYGVRHAEILIDKITSITYKSGLVLGEINIQCGSETKSIKNVSKLSTAPFVDVVHKSMELFNNQKPIEIQNQPVSVADELLKFKSLLDAGLITESDFEKQKEKLLNS